MVKEEGAGLRYSQWRITKGRGPVPLFGVASAARGALRSALLGSVALLSVAATVYAADKTLVDKGEVLVRRMRRATV